MANSTDLRGNRFIWGMRIAQCIVAIVIVAFAAINTMPWKTSLCSTPKRLAWNIACAAMTIPMTLYFIFTTGLAAKWGFWHAWAQLPLDGVFLLFWVLATALSPYDCGDMCNACGGEATTYSQYVNSYSFDFISRLEVAGTACYCSFNGYSLDKRTPRGRGGSSSGSSSSSSDSSSGGDGGVSLNSITKKGAAFLVRQSLDGVMIFFFLVTLVAGLWFYFRGSRSSSSRAAPAAAPEQIPGVPVYDEKAVPQTHIGETDVAGNPIYRSA